MKKFRILYILSLLTYTALFTYTYFHRNAPSTNANVVYAITGVFLIYFLALTIYRGRLLEKNGRKGFFASGFYLAVIFLLSYLRQLNIYLLAIK